MSAQIELFSAVQIKMTPEQAQAKLVRLAQERSSIPKGDRVRWLSNLNQANRLEKIAFPPATPEQISEANRREKYRKGKQWWRNK